MLGAVSKSRFVYTNFGYIAAIGIIKVNKYIAILAVVHAVKWLTMRENSDAKIDEAFGASGRPGK